MKPILYSLLIAFLFTACAKSGETVNVQALNQQFISAWNNKDADKITSLLAEDVHFLQGEVHFNGKSEVADKWVRATVGTIADLKTNVVSSATDSEIAYEGGTFSVDVLPEEPDQPHGYGEGNFLLLWKKDKEGNWKLSYAQLEDLPVEARNK
ncbi:YybH family protein [Adhaeribacter rhizoryzae]|uniref:Nuclear transport factor 2 family protein n=1 Tax=Adhaeribacter rhizoryzae TaxID=2607907 RepID=A0A5M6DBG8_9BACT|nr:nuclear transport factor 2 family protein [Adhaeribacter rhizoryzae]KAA5543399.1 nuclear transport factor 2 family protein [Adhaeribacter rhizoryzae]